MDQNDIKNTGLKSTTESVVDDQVQGRSFTNKLRGYLLAGILVTAPIAITIYLTYVFLNFVDTKVAQMLPDAWYYSLYSVVTVPGVGLIIAIVFFIILGSKDLRNWIKPALILWAAAISLAQVYVGVHYPIDILAGTAVGYFVARIVTFTIALRKSHLPV